MRRTSRRARCTSSAGSSASSAGGRGRRTSAPRSRSPSGGRRDRGSGRTAAAEVAVRSSRSPRPAASIARDAAFERGRAHRAPGDAADARLRRRGELERARGVVAVAAQVDGGAVDVHDLHAEHVAEVPQLRSSFGVRSSTLPRWAMSCTGSRGVSMALPVDGGVRHASRTRRPESDLGQGAGDAALHPLSKEARIQSRIESEIALTQGVNGGCFPRCSDIP